jgi:hemoglobin-like flavoprotein
MHEDTLELFNNSFEACVLRAGFLERFYQIFIDASPEVRDKFTNTNLAEQVRVMKRSLLLLTVASSGAEGVDEEIVRLGQKHGPQGLAVGAHLYDLWLDSLLQAVREFDPRWSPQVEESWRRMFIPYIDALKRFS